MTTGAGAPSNDAHHAAERVARESYGRLLASLASRTRDVAGAEDALADAFAAALRTWPSSGVPDNPAAWLLTAARRRQTDAFRRRRTHEASEPHLRLMAEHLEDVARTPDEIPDSRLALMFACAHPAIEPGIRTPLILQTLLGLNADTIAAAFLLPPATMGQRLVRAKTRIRQTGIPFRIPEREELPARLDAVLAAIYAAFAIGWADEVDAGRSPLADEAIWLGELVVSLLPDEPEAKGMLALMCYVDARRPARRDAAGAYVPLDAQDVGVWNDAQMRKGETLLHAANADGPTGRYQLEAAIQSAHMTQRLTGTDTRRAVLALYDHLVALTRSPVAALNRAAAVAALDGPAAALAALAPLATEPRMQRYQPYWALRGQLLAESGRASEAHEALTVAIGLSTDTAVRQFLDVRRQALTSRRTGE